MLLISKFRYSTLIIGMSLRLRLASAIFFIFAFCLSGCDSLYVKRVDLHRPNEPLQIKIYEDSKTTVISVIDRIALENSMVCRKQPGVSRYCSQPPKTLVAFEDKYGFSICLFMLGTDWDNGKFLHLAETLEKALTGSIQGTQLNISLPGEIPECIVPQSP